MLVNKAYKVRLYPNKEQEHKLVAILDGCRWVYNHYLEERKRYYLDNKKTLPYAIMARDLTKFRHEIAQLKDLQAEPLQQSLRRLDTAYNSFFRKQNKFPKFKSRFDSRQSFQKHQDWRIREGKIQIQSGLLIKFRGFIDDSSELGSLVVSYHSSGKWFASIFAQEEVCKVPRKTAAIGVDVGIETLATLSTGEKFINLGAQKTLQRKLTKAQRELARCAQGSKRREKAKREVARIYGRIANVRLNHIHHVSRAIVNKNPKLIAIEDLSVKKMMKNRIVVGSLPDASLREVLRQITYKQKWSGGDVVKIDRYFPSSKTCSKCTFIIDSLPLSKRTWNCPECGAKHDRDVNAAKNILAQAK